MSSTLAAKNAPYNLGGEENEHMQQINSSFYSSNRRGPTHIPQTEAYKYNSMSDNVPPASEYLRAPVCCSECEEFWKALILEIDEKHTSRVPAGKASLIMAKGTSGSVIQIKSTKYVPKERRIFPGLSCMNPMVRTDAFSSVIGSTIHLCQPRVSVAREFSSNSTLIKSGNRCHESPEKKLNITTIRSSHGAPSSGLPSVSRQFELQDNQHRSAGTYNSYGAASRYDVVSTPRRHSHSHSHGHIPNIDRGKRVVHPEPLETSPRFTQNSSHHLSTNSSKASQAHMKGDRQEARPYATLGGKYFKPIRTRFDGGRAEEGLSHLSTPRSYTPIYNEDFASQSLQHPSYADSTDLRMYSSLSYERPMSQIPRASALQAKHVEEFFHCNYPARTPETPGSRGRRGAQQHTLREPNNVYGADRGSPKYGSFSGEILQNSAPPHHQSSQNARSSSHDTPAERKLSRTSTIESGYTSLSIPRSDCSASSSNSQELDQDSPPSSPRSKIRRARGFATKCLQPNDPPRNADSDIGLSANRISTGLSLKSPHHGDNLSRTSTSTSSLMEPLVLFTDHGCLYETDENSKESDSDIKVTNPNYSTSSPTLTTSSTSSNLEL